MKDDASIGRGIPIDQLRVRRQMNHLFTRLFRYRETEGRAPVEDFLTEIFCEFLNALSDVPSLHALALAKLLDIPNYGDDPAATRIVWSTQRTISSDGDPSHGLRPDITGVGSIRGERALIIIENKVSAGFTFRMSEDGRAIHQIESYKDYLARQSTYTHRHLRLLTFDTTPPADLIDPCNVFSWVAVGRGVNQIVPRLRQHSAVAAFIAENLLAFLQENGMADIPLTLSDVAAFSASKRVLENCNRLAKRAPDLRESPIGKRLANLRTTKNRVLLPPDGRSCGELTWPKFFGRILTPTSPAERTPLRANDSAIVCWAGVMTDNVYGIRLQYEDIPELSVGFGIWGDAEGLKKRIGSEILDGIGRSLATGWEDSQFLRNEDYGEVRFWKKVLSLSDIAVKHSGEESEIAASFFSQAVRELEAVADEAWAHVVEAVQDEDENGDEDE